MTTATKAATSGHRTNRSNAQPKQRKPRRFRPAAASSMRSCSSEIRCLLATIRESEVFDESTPLAERLVKQARAFADAYDEWALGTDCVDRVPPFIFDVVNDLVLWASKHEFRLFSVGDDRGRALSKMFRKKRPPIPCRMCSGFHDYRHGCPSPRSACAAYIAESWEGQPLTCPSNDWRSCGHASPPGFGRATPANYSRLATASYRAYALAKKVEPLCQRLGELERLERKLRSEKESVEKVVPRNEELIAEALHALDEAEAELEEARAEAGDWTFTDLLREAGSAYREALAEAEAFIPMPDGVEPEYRRAYMVSKANPGLSKCHVLVYGGWRHDGNAVLKRRELLIEFFAKFWEHIVSGGSIFVWEVPLKRQDVGRDPTLQRIQSLTKRIAYRHGIVRWFANPSSSTVIIYATVQIPKDPGIELSGVNVLEHLLGVIEQTDLPKKPQYGYKTFSRAYGGAHEWEWQPHASVTREWRFVGWGSSLAPEEQEAADAERAASAGIKSTVASEAEVSMRAPGRIRHTQTFEVPHELGSLVDSNDPLRGCYLYHLHFAKDYLGLRLLPEAFAELRDNWLVILRAVNYVKRRAA